VSGEPPTQDRPAWLPPLAPGADAAPPPRPFVPPAPPRPAEPPWAAARAQWSVEPAWSAPPEPPNKPANTGFALSISAAGLLLFTVGVLSFATLPLAIAGWVQGRNGLRKIELGETTKNGTLARSAMVIGIITTVLSALALVVWIVYVVRYSPADSGAD
jgi:hypothetical protein